MVDAASIEKNFDFVKFTLDNIQLCADTIYHISVTEDESLEKLKKITSHINTACDLISIFEDVVDSINKSTDEHRVRLNKMLPSDYQTKIEKIKDYEKTYNARVVKGQKEEKERKKKLESSIHGILQNCKNMLDNMINDIDHQHNMLLLPIHEGMEDIYIDKIKESYVKAWKVYIDMTQLIKNATAEEIAQMDLREMIDMNLAFSDINHSLKQIPEMYDTLNKHAD